MFEKLVKLVTSKQFKKALILVKFMFVILLMLIVIHEASDSPPVQTGPTPAEALVMLQRELHNFRMLPGSRLITYPARYRERSAALQADHDSCGSYEVARNYYIAEAERNGWKLEKEDVKKQQVTFGKSDLPKSNYRLHMTFSGNDVLLEFSWRSGY